MTLLLLGKSNDPHLSSHLVIQACLEPSSDSVSYDRGAVLEEYDLETPQDAAIYHSYPPVATKGLKQLEEYGGTGAGEAVDVLFDSCSGRREDSMAGDTQGTRPSERSLPTIPPLYLSPAIIPSVRAPPW